VYSTALQSNGKFIIAGAFSSVNETYHPGLARLNSDGTLDTGFYAVAGEVRAVALQSDNKILIGGYFRSINGLPVAHIARLWASADIPPHIQNLTWSGAAASLTWDAIPERTYRAQYKESLSSPTWTDLAGDVLGPSSGIAVATDTNATNASQRFYRVVLLP
jgi:hypothetical protein